MYNNNQNNGFYMPVQPAGYGYGYGNGGGLLGGEGLLGLVALAFVFMMFGGGFGGGWGGMGGMNMMYPWLNQSNQVADGFANQANGIALNGIQGSISALQPQLCNGFSGVTAAVTGAQNAISQQLFGNQIAEMQNDFQMQTLMNQGFNQAQAERANCCCENRLAVCQTQNMVQREAAETRAAVLGMGQTILDKMCQDKIDAKNEKIVEQAAEINNLKNNNYVQNALTAQTQYLIDQLSTAAAARTTAAAAA